VIASKFDRRFVLIILSSSAVAIVGCAALVIASLFTNSQAYRYPNSTAGNVCPAPQNNIYYIAAIRHISISSLHSDCYSSASPPTTVLSWYKRQGWLIEPFTGSADINTSYTAGPFDLLFIQQVFVSSPNGRTQIVMESGFLLEIRLP
jgi:hypothetical protein